jgi:hypothetical protein
MPLIRSPKYPPSPAPFDLPIYRFIDSPISYQFSSAIARSLYAERLLDEEDFFKKSFSASHKAPEMIRKSAIPIGIV